MKETNVKEQELIINKYKVNHRRRFLWHRIVSVLSAIMVFCATYALLLPAFTMEDPTVGVKLSNQYTYENENLSAVFTVTGRAIFKEENIEIENPQAEFVDLNVVVLEKEDRAYKAYAEYASDSIGEEELANIMAFELKFTYMGHELDMKKCDIVAEINAKEVFFTDDFGTEYDGAVYVADPAHPMADKNTESSAPAMAFTAIQGTSFNIYDAPTVYTTDVEEVSTLTVDVKGETLALLTSATSNPTFTVQYYAMVTRIDTEPDDITDLRESDVIDTRGREGPPKSNQTLENLKQTKIYFKSSSEAAAIGKAYSVVSERKITKIYEEQVFNFAYATKIENVNRLAENSNYRLERVRLLKGEDPESVVLGDWEQYDVSNELSFTNNESLANSKDKIYVEEGSVVRLVYVDSGTNQLFDDEVTMFDYDISDGKYYTTTGAEKETSTQVDGSTAYMKTNKQGINSFNVASNLPTFAFGSVNTGNGFDDSKSFQTWNGLHLNAAVTFGLVSGIDNDSADFVPVFSSGFNAPDVFSLNNEHNPSGNTATELAAPTALVANYEAVNNVNTGTVDKNSLVWKDLTDKNADITVIKDANNYFTDNAYKVNGGKLYLPLSITTNYINAKTMFTIELAFGDIRNAGEAPILLSDESGTNLLKLSIDKDGNLCLYRNSIREICVSNGIDLVSYSTITIVHANRGTAANQYLRLYCDGVIIGSAAVANFNLGNNRLCFGTFDSSDSSKHNTEYRSIRVYNGNLGQSSVQTNAEYNKTRSVSAANDSTAGGKTVVGGRVIEFRRNCDTYTLTSIKNGTKDLENLEYFSSWVSPHDGSETISNDFWPMDHSGTYGENGHDIKFGTNFATSVGATSFPITRRFFGLQTIAFLNNPYGMAYKEPPAASDYATWRPNLLPVSDDNKDHNSYFGMKYKVNFNLEEDYVGPLEYFFYGDDDLWVFLDDTLVCDIGGVHSSVGQIVDLWDYLPDTGYEGDHTLYMFYLERGASGSSCYMQFTLPSASINTPQQSTTSLSLEKELKNSDSTADFEFDIELRDLEGELLANNYYYTVFDKDGLETGESGTITAGKGTVQLKGGEKILINFLPVGTKYKITENEDVFFTSYSVNGDTAVEGKSVEGALNVATSVVFTNTAGDKLPSTGVLGGGMSVVIYYIPLGIATVYMCAMPIINRPKKTKEQ